MPKENTEEIVIERQNFDNAMKSIEDYALKADNKTALAKVPTSGGLFNKGEHKVTGREFNERLSQIESGLIDLKDFDSRTLDIVMDIYKALEALDKEHISGILIAANTAKQASDKANKTVDAMKKTVDVLRNFNKSLNELKHLMDIDALWEVSNSQANKLDAQKQEIENVRKLLNNLQDISDRQANRLKVQNKEIENIRELLNILKEDLYKKISSQQDFIEQELKKSKSESQEKFDTFNKIFNEKNNTLFNMQKKVADTLNNIKKVQNEKFNSIDTSFQSEKKFCRKQIVNLTQKIKISYIVAGTSVAITIIHITLNILGVM